MVSTDGDLKSFGQNWAGHLGYGDTENRGDDSDEMGDNLPVVDLGSNFTIADMTGGNRVTCM